MNVIVFIGPTLKLDEAKAVFDGFYLAPAAKGDVYRATLMKPAPQVIAIIDGNFSHQASVNHKEILWAMSQGIHVFGASSMGALRAAELSAFGMVGFGRVFDTLKSNEIEDDDDVAVAHGPAETGFVQLSEAMVDMRATFARAAAEKVISDETDKALCSISKQTFYPERSYGQTIFQARKSGRGDAEMDNLESWLATGKINQKKMDALALLRHLKELMAGNPERKSIHFTFEITEFWSDGLARMKPLDLGSRRR